MSLSWALAISTLDRPAVLVQAVKCAMAQSRPPSEVVIVDASDEWEASRASVMSEMNGIPLKYIKATYRSSATQRNEAISAATADILFLLDDDSLMYSNCAGEIMSAYEADINAEIAGIGATGVSQSPISIGSDFATKVTGSSSAPKLLNKIAQTVLGKFFTQKILLLKYEESFLHYNERSFPLPKLPRHLAGNEKFWGTNTVPGYALTVRRLLAQKHMFDPALRYYSAMEDADFCQRLLADGSLVVSRLAHVHHFQVAVGRIGRDKVTALQLLNLAVFLRRHSRKLPQKKRQYYLLLARRVIAEFLKDGLARRLSFPHVRGVIMAAAYVKFVFSTSPIELDTVYPEIQSKILNAR